MLHATRFRSQPSVHFLQYEWFGLRAQTKSRLHIIRIFLSSFCYYLNTRHSNFSLRWWDEGNILLSLEHIHSGIIAGVTIFTRCNVLMLTGCSCSLFPGQCWWHGPGSWQGVMTVSRKCEDVMLSRIRPTPVMMSARVTTLHPLVTFANTNNTVMMIRYKIPFSPNIYIRVCVQQIPVIVSRENVCLDNCLFIYTLPSFSC